MTVQTRMRLKWLLRCVVVLTVGGLALIASAPRQARGDYVPVPKEYQDLYAELERNLDAFDAVVTAEWDGRKHAATFTAELLSANSNVGPWLPTSDQYLGVQLELDRLKSLGVSGITLSIHFPILYEPFHEDRETYLRYLDFYTALAGDIHDRGLKLVVETQALFSFGTPLRPFYQTLSWEGYTRARADVAETIVRQLRPDYLSVVSEPDTEAILTGKAEANDLAASTAMVTTIVDRVKSVRGWKGQVGAGVGSWHFAHADFVNAYCRDAKVDYVSVHVYPIVKDFLARTLVISDIAKTYDKPVVLGEGWLYKTGESELTSPPWLEFDRDPFSFWAPLDAKYLQVMVKLARTGRIDVLSPFWSRYFFAYLEYNDTTKHMNGNELNVLVGMLAGQNMANGIVTTTGQAFSDAISGLRR